MSNFLGDTTSVVRYSHILSMTELMSREMVNLQKGMNYRDDGVMLSVFLVLPTHEGGYADTWDAERGVYTYLGHDSTTVESGAMRDQLMMYESGRLTDNGKFYKAAQSFRDKQREEALRIQVYEKLDAGVWYDKGIFELIDARHEDGGSGKRFEFDLVPVGLADSAHERMMSAREKTDAWEVAAGRCGECGVQEGLSFVQNGPVLELKCAVHTGARRGLLG